MFTKTLTARNSEIKNGAQGRASNLLGRVQSHSAIDGSRSERNMKDFGPGPMTYVVDANGISNQSKQRANKSVYRNN